MSEVQSLPLAGDRIIDIAGGYTIIFKTDHTNFLVVEDPMVCITDDGERYVVNPQSGAPEIGRLEIAKQGRIVSAVYTDEYLLTVLFDNGFSFFVEPNHDGYESWHAKWGDELLVAMWEPGLGNQ